MEKWFKDKVMAIANEPDDEQPKFTGDIRDTYKGITRKDPMSPYEAPRSPMNFQSLADIINRKPFKGAYPQSFTVVPEYFRRFGFSPYYDPEDFADYARGSLTIAIMIDLTVKDQPWALDRDQDVELVYDIVAAYYKELLDPKLPKDNRIKAYIQKIEKFLKVMSRGLDKIEHRTGKDRKPLSLKDILAKFIRS